MKKSSLIRKMLESYRFHQIGQKNCFITYSEQFCFEISFFKVGYGSRWKIEISINMLNAKRYEMGNCPSDYPIALSGIDITLEEWRAEKERYPDKYSESIIFIINEYIRPYLTKIACYNKVDDFENYIYITKSETPFEFEEKFRFKALSNISYVDNYEMLLSKDEFKTLFNYLKKNLYEYIKSETIRGNYEMTYFNPKNLKFIIIIIEKELFLSFEVFTQEMYEHRDYMVRTEYTITYYKGTLQFSFGWLIADDENLGKNVKYALEALNKNLGCNIQPSKQNSP